jgi:hypothetical protein
VSGLHIDGHEPSDSAITVLVLVLLCSRVLRLASRGDWLSLL